METSWVLVRWPPTKEQLDAMRSVAFKAIFPNGSPFEEADCQAFVWQAFNDGVRASPVAADDPAMVERVARTACRATGFGGPCGAFPGPCDAPEKHCAGFIIAREVLGLFSPPKE